VVARANGTAYVGGVLRGKRDSSLAVVGCTGAASLTLAPDSAALASVGDTTSFAATLMNACSRRDSITPVTFISRNSAVATVQATGPQRVRVTATGNGLTYLISSVGSLRDSSRVCVSSGVVLDVSPGTLTLDIDGTGGLTATLTTCGAPGSISWTSRNTGVATASPGTGTATTVTGEAEGATYVVATSGAAKDSSAVEVQGTPPPPTADRLDGVHNDFGYFGSGSERTNIVAKSDELGSDIVRSTVYRKGIETSPGVYNWTNLDGGVNATVAAGQEILFFFGGSPQWVNNSTDPWVVPTDQTAFNAFVSSWAAFATVTVNRYKDRVTKWEIWNEQNEIYFWKPTPDIAKYWQLYEAMYNAIKAADPTAEVSIGGLTGIGAGCCINAKTFLQGLYDRGLANKVDAINIHPYAIQNQDPSVCLQFQMNFQCDIEAIRAIMVARGDSDSEVWISEWGWKTDVVGEATAAAYITESFQIIDQMPYVTVATYFVLMDSGGYTQGLYRSNWTAKAGAAAFQSAIATY
jgi:hypothetical protein